MTQEKKELTQKENVQKHILFCPAKGKPEAHLRFSNPISWNSSIYLFNPRARVRGATLFCLYYERFAGKKGLLNRKIFAEPCKNLTNRHTVWYTVLEKRLRPKSLFLRKK